MQFTHLTADINHYYVLIQIFGYTLHYTGKLQSSSHVFAGLLALVSCVTSSLGLGIGAIFPNGTFCLSISKL